MTNVDSIFNLYIYICKYVFLYEPYMNIQNKKCSFLCDF